MKNNQYMNPIYKHEFPDPTIGKVGDTYYLYSTAAFGDYHENGQPFFSRGVIIKSKDLCNYEYVGEIFSEDEYPRWGTKNAGVWAPDFLALNGKYYLYYSLSILFDDNASIGIAVSDSPEGPFKDLGPIIRSKDIEVNNSIDPTVFRAYDGKLYIIWGSYRGIYGSELSDDGLALVGEKKHIAGFDKGEIDLDTYEAAFMVKRKGMYYLFFSTGKTLDGDKCTYHVVCAKSKYPLGPFSDSQGNTLQGRNEGDVVVTGLDNHFVGTGHCCVKEVGGDFWIFYHGVEIDQKYPEGYSRRILSMDKLLWDENEMPYVEGKVCSYQELKEGPKV
ncbi:MAG: family 43 glycosylhydrolase [Bacilli bacterium]|jgi:arabinan endo-1,5-alpha-L-arabinosidase